MKKAWKWILGILVVVLIVAVLVTVPFVMGRNMSARANFANQPQLQQPPQQQQGLNNGPMMGRNQRGGNGFPGLMPGRMGNRGGFRAGFGAFGFGLMFLGWLLRLISLVLFGLLIFGVYQLGKRSGLRSAQAVVMPAPVTHTAVAPDPIVPDSTSDTQTPVP